VASTPLNISRVPGAWSVTVHASTNTSGDSFTAYALCADTTP
jgi:hypothetical protein